MHRSRIMPLYRMIVIVFVLTSVFCFNVSYATECLAETRKFLLELMIRVKYQVNIFFEISAFSLYICIKQDYI